MCVVELAAGGIGIDGAPLVLESCAKAVALGDGRDLFSLQPGGQLLNVPGGKCASVGKSEVTEGSVVSFVECDGASQWEVQSNGQLKLNAVGDFCLTQEGVAPGPRDVAADAAGMSSSTANAFSHGPFFPGCLSDLALNVREVPSWRWTANRIRFGPRNLMISPSLWNSWLIWELVSRCNLWKFHGSFQQERFRCRCLMMGCISRRCSQLMRMWYPLLAWRSKGVSLEKSAS